MLTVVPDESDGRKESTAVGAGAGSSSLIDGILRESVRRILAEALQAEVDAYIAQIIHERDERGRRLVMRNGSHDARTVLTSAGAVEVQAPRTHVRPDRLGHWGALPVVLTG